MKNIKLTFALLLLSLNAFSTIIDVSSKITDVTVFLSGAHVNRTASINIPKGKSEIYLSEITPLLAKESIQVKGIGKFTIISVNHQIDENYITAPKEKVEILLQKMKNLTQKIEEIAIKIDVYGKEIMLIENTSYTSKNAVDVKIENVKSTQNYYHTTLLDLKLGKLKLKRELKTVNIERIKIQQELDGFKVKKSSSKSVIKVVVESAVATKAKFEISYFVANAKWHPEYDVRVKNISSPLTLNYKANISQQTGEDWKNVKLTISTSSPNKSNRRPILKKWIVNTSGSHLNNETFTNNYLTYSGQQFAKAQGIITDQYGEPLPFVNILVPGSSTGTTTDFDGRFQLVLPKGASKLEFRYVGYKTQIKKITNDLMRVVLEESQELLEVVEIVNYKVPLIDKEGSFSSTTILREDLARMPGRTNGVSVNAMSSQINIRGSRMNDPYQYIDGIKVRTGGIPASYTFEKEVNMVDVSFTADGKYTINADSKYQVVAIKEFNIASSYLYYCAPKLDKDVFLTAQIVDWEKYNLLEGQVSIYYEGTFMGTTLMDVRYVSDTLNLSIGRDKNILVQREKIKESSNKKVFGNTVTNQKSWKMVVKNNKNVPINILVEDQFPVSTNKQVIVKHEETNNPKIDSDKGIVSWKFENLPPSEKKQMELMYSVKYPRFVQMNIE